jgi:hypothetical protein
MCHHPKDRFTLKIMAIATKHHGNRTKKRGKVKNSSITCDADAILTTKKHGKLRRKIVAIATKKRGREKTHQQLTTQMPYLR